MSQANSRLSAAGSYSLYHLAAGNRCFRYRLDTASDIDHTDAGTTDCAGSDPDPAGKKQS